LEFEKFVVREKHGLVSLEIVVESAVDAGLYFLEGKRHRKIADRRAAREG
jgi:hypothetical protein